MNLPEISSIFEVQVWTQLAWLKAGQSLDPSGSGTTGREGASTHLSWVASVRLAEAVGRQLASTPLRRDHLGAEAALLPLLEMHQEPVACHPPTTLTRELASSSLASISRT
jgi:hypothetical protein